MTDKIEISAIVPIVKLVDRSGELVGEYIDILEATGRPFELIYVMDGEHEDVFSDLLKMAETEHRLRIVQLAKSFGEATAMNAGFANARGEVILTLPAYWQVETEEIPALLDALQECDVAVAVRRSSSASMSGFQRFRRRVFHWVVGLATRQSFGDLGCGVRALKRKVAEELTLYGDQHRFFAVLAARRGFRVKEVTLSETSGHRISDSHGPRAYIARFLDIFAIVFLTRFTSRPLRFFGGVGSALFAFGAVAMAILLSQRIFLGVALADRPALLLTSLSVVLGLQLFALGLLGELIIFTHARDIKEYTIEKIVN